MRILVPAVALVAWLSVAPARADNLDAGLCTYAPEIMKYLRAHHCTSVGVFKFRVKKGNQPVSLKAGPVNTNLAARLENALVLANDPANPIAIIHDADRVALEKKLPRYSTPEGRRQVFNTDFPLAYGNATVRPHTFLTGVVHVTPDMKKATVTVEAFDKQATDTTKVVSFEIPVDRALLGDLGQSFQLSRSALRKTRGSFEELEEAASASAASLDQAGTPPTQSAEKPIELEILYDDRVQTISPDPDNGGELRVPEPRPGQKVKIAFKNVSDETVGVVVMVNGVSSNRMQTDEPVHCRKWLPGPGQRYVLEGFQIDENTVRPWRVATAAESEALEYTDNLGLIAVYVFRSGKDILKIAGKTEPPEEPPPPPGMKISRGVSVRPAGAASRSARPASFRDLQKSLEKKTGVVLRPGAAKTREAIVAGEGTVEGKVVLDKLPNPVQVWSVQVRYYKPKGK